MHAIAEAVTQCKFEATDPAADEVVLYKISQVRLFGNEQQQHCMHACMYSDFQLLVQTSGYVSTNMHLLAMEHLCLQPFSLRQIAHADTAM